MWERDLGLPIHRLDGSPKARVFAHRDELDRWLDEKLHEREFREHRDFRSFFGRRNRPGLALLALFAGAAVFLSVRFLRPKDTPAPHSPKEPISLAVLPFVDMSAGKGYEYLGDGIAETLIESLGRRGELRVPGRTSAFSFKGMNAGLHEIGSRLRVQTILEGSVQVVEERLRVSCRLCRAEDGHELWAETYDRELDDIFSVQDDIIRKIIMALRMKSVESEGEPVLRAYTTNREAYLLYLKGRYFLGEEDGN